MDTNILNSNDEHQQISLLLPWYLNNSLQPDERHQVEHHLRSCVLCKQEVNDLRKLAKAVKGETDYDVSANRAFERLRSKIQADRPGRHRPELTVISRSSGQPGQSVEIEGAEQGAAPAPAPKKGSWYHSRKQGMHFAIAASLVLAVMPIAMHFSQSPVATDYYTLSDDGSASAVGRQLRVVFAKSVSDSDIRALLAQIHGQRIGGPNSVGAYTVELSSDSEAVDVSSAIAFLRAQAQVTLAEPVLQR